MDYGEGDDWTPGGGGMGGGGGQLPGPAPAPAPSPTEIAAAMAPELEKAVAKVSRPITIAPNIKIDEDPNQTAQAREERRQMTVNAIASAFRDREPGLMVEARRALNE